jgi:D-alanine-D-alanine ligase
MKRIVVLTGGSTPERDVAFAGAAQVVRALRERDYQVSTVDTVEGLLDAQREREVLDPPVGRAPPSIDELRALAEKEHPEELVSLPELRTADAVFLVLHGRLGEGGEIQALLELVGVPYTGSGPLGSGLAMDKDIAKRLFERGGVPTAPWAMWPASDGVVAELGFPLVVKPSNVGSSVGLTVVDSASDVAAAIELARGYDTEIMLERFIDGREFTVGVLDDHPLAVGEIIPRHAIFDYECKYTPGMTAEVFPAELPAAEAERLQDLAVRAHRLLKLRDFSRVDFRIDSRGGPCCLEVNTLPGLTATSLLPQSAAACGIPFHDLCERIVGAAVGRAAP